MSTLWFFSGLSYLHICYTIFQLKISNILLTESITLSTVDVKRTEAQWQENKQAGSETWGVEGLKLKLWALNWDFAHWVYHKGQEN